jgi:hypothetical protein
MHDMKNLFSVNVNDEENDALDKNPFVLRRTDPEISKKMEDLFDTDEADSEKSAKEPASAKILRILRVVCGYISLIMLAGIIKALPEVGAAAFIKVPWITSICIISGIAFLILNARKVRNDKTKKQEKEKSEADESEDYEEALKKIVEEAYVFLKIPSSAQSTDTFVRLYKIKNGKEKNGSSLFQFMNTEHKIFLEDRSLCLADAESVQAIPLENITGIYKVDKRIKFFGWNKAEEYRSDRYKPYQIKQSGFALTVKNCYALRFHSDFGEDYEILFPAYELDTWTSLTGVEAKENT